MALQDLGVAMCEAHSKLEVRSVSMVCLHCRRPRSRVACHPEESSRAWWPSDRCSSVLELVRPGRGARLE